MLSAAGLTGTGPVCEIPGWRISPGLLDGRNEIGYFSSGNGFPAGMGRTTSGVMMTSNSLLPLIRVVDWNSLPNSGMSPIPGILFRFFVVVLSSSP